MRCVCGAEMSFVNEKIAPMLKVFRCHVCGRTKIVQVEAKAYGTKTFGSVLDGVRVSI